MSTGYTNTTAKRIALLARQNETIFHAQDLATLWNISSKNSLYTTLKRYYQKGLLFRIFKGLYSLTPPQKLDPLLLGVKVVHQYAYVSTETVLFQEGIISQPGSYITLISSKPLQFNIEHHAYRCRQLQDKYLFQPEGIYSRNGINIAHTERAIADLLYFNPQATLDARDSINWAKVNDIQRKVGYRVTA